METIDISLEKDKGLWLIDALNTTSVSNEKIISYAQFKTDFEMYFEDFELFWFSKPIKLLKLNGLLQF